jgi:hypothetical protein
VRLKRLSPSSIHKEEQRQVIVPLSKQVDPAEALVTLLAELVPVETGSLAS